VFKFNKCPKYGEITVLYSADADEGRGVEVYVGAIVREV
jgi:hypothetical protein